MNHNQKCVRVFADIHQIEGDKEALGNIQESLSTIAGRLSLAGNETRLKILYLLYKERKLCVCDLGDVLEMKTPAVSQHLRKLKDGAMIYAEKKGQTIFYKLNDEASSLLKPLFEKLQLQEGQKQESVKNPMNEATT